MNQIRTQSGTGFKSRKISDGMNTEISSKSNGLCWYCGCKLNTANGTIDHQTPLGGNHISNLVYACRSCNSRKKNKDLEGYRQYASWQKSHIPKFTHRQVQYLLSVCVDISLLSPISIKFYGETI